MAQVALRNVVKTFDKTPAVRGIDLDIADREFIVLVGPSGCGKSTTLRMIAGLEETTSGEIFIGDQLVNDVPPKDRDIAMVFQNYALYPHMTVFENMSFGLRLRKFPKPEIKERVEAAARILDITDLLQRQPKQLSGGQRQRVAMGRAIVRNPKVFLFDEPLSNLDAKLRVQMRTEIKKVHQKVTTTTVYVTHDQIEAMTLADKIVLLHAGKDTERYGSIAQIGAPLELYHRPNSRFVAGFIGSPRMNFLPGKVAAIDPRGVSVKLDQSGETVRVSVDGKALSIGQTVTFGVRPEHLELTDTAASDVVQPNDAPSASLQSTREDALLTRTVSLVEQLGEHSYVHLDEADGIALIAKAPGDTRLKQGDRASFRAPASVCHLFSEDGFAVASLESVEHYA
jgi:multiple sugar transport system ATP-binding protein